MEELREAVEAGGEAGGAFHVGAVGAAPLSEHIERVRAAIQALRAYSARGAWRSSSHGRPALAGIPRGPHCPARTAAPRCCGGGVAALVCGWRGPIRASHNFRTGLAKAPQQTLCGRFWITLERCGHTARELSCGATARELARGGRPNPCGTTSTNMDLSVWTPPAASLNAARVREV